MPPQHPPPSNSPHVDAILDKGNFTLEEILKGEDILMECRTFNNRLINFLCGRNQVEQMLRYILEEPPENSDLPRIYVYPCTSSEILTLNVKAILTTILEEEQLMDLLFSFLDPKRSHNVVLAEYFSKVVLCLIHRRALRFMVYVQGHLDVFRKLVDLIEVSSIMQFLVNLFGSDRYYPDRLVMMQWLAQSNLLEMIVDKLDANNSPTIHSSAAEILCAVAGNFMSPLGLKLSNPRFIEALFGHALQDPISKSSLAHSLTICIVLLEPKRATTYSPSLTSFRRLQISRAPNPAIREIIRAMLPKLDDLRRLLDASGNEENLPTTYGEFKPPLGRHRLKIVEFMSVLMSVGDDVVARELVGSGNIHRVVDLFFEYPFNNFLHRHIVVIIALCLHSNNLAVVDHLLQDCNLIGKILRAENNVDHADVVNQPTVFSAGRRPPRAGNSGHITSIANLLVQLGHIYGHIQAHVQEHREWNEWQARVLRQRNAVDNVFSWTCGRPVVDRGDADRIRRDQCAPNKDDDEENRYNEDDDDEDNRYNEDDDDEDDDDDEAIAPAAPNQEVDVVSGYNFGDAMHFDADGSPEVATSSRRLSDNPRKRRCGLFTNAGRFSHKDDQSTEAAAPDSPSDSLELGVRFYGASNKGNDNRNQVCAREMTSPMKYTRRIILRFAAKKGELSYQTAEASTGGSHLIGQNDSAPEDDQLFPLRGPLPTETGSGEPGDAEVSRAGSNQTESDDHDTDQSGDLPK